MRSKLRCTICNTPFPINRTRPRETNHLKPIWCYVCKKRTLFKENTLILPKKNRRRSEEKLIDELQLLNWEEIFDINQDNESNNH